MAAFDKDTQPLADDEAINQHIERALRVRPPSGVDLQLAYQLVKKTLQPEITGVENIPHNPCLFVGNHSLFALDGLVVMPLFLKELRRFPRSMGDRFLFANPRVGNFILRNGGVMGHPKVCSALMEDGQDLLVFPGGAYEAVKPLSQLYELQWKERHGFVRLAAENGYTIMPFGLVGPDEFYGHLMEGQDIPDSKLGKALTRVGLLNSETRTDILPPIPIGALGSVLPKPQKCFLGFGKPVDLSQHKGKTLTMNKLRNLRERVANEIETQIDVLLESQAKSRQHQGLVRRLLTR
ncbi:MAG: lysophospholipid acyltransferase family protein [Halioglobus sp.]